MIFLCFFVFKFSFYCLHVLCYSHCIVTSRVCRDVFCTHNNNNNRIVDGSLSARSFGVAIIPKTTFNIAGPVERRNRDDHDRSYIRLYSATEYLNKGLGHGAYVSRVSTR